MDSKPPAPTTVSLADEEAVKLIFVGPMWKGLVDWATAQMLRPGFELASAQDMQIPRCAERADQAIAMIREDQARWQAAQGPTGVSMAS